MTSSAKTTVVAASGLALLAATAALSLLVGSQGISPAAVLGALREHLPSARVEGVAAGLHLLVTLPGAPDLDDAVLAGRARAAGVVVHPLSWHRQRPGPTGLVLGYAAHPPDRLRDAVRRIALAVPRR